ncbi:MAG: hypothetical protein MUP58_02515 [Candidatus Nanohaloarchaeota archaeon QJJ-9]|nr:hypothetical protein [Candidatus Nanohaloarchaeota archaeon QJJ-9]
MARRGPQEFTKQLLWKLGVIIAILVLVKLVSPYTTAAYRASQYSDTGIAFAVNILQGFEGADLKTLLLDFGTNVIAPFVILFLMIYEVMEAGVGRLLNSKSLLPISIVLTSSLLVTGDVFVRFSRLMTSTVTLLLFSGLFLVFSFLYFRVR